MRITKLCTLAAAALLAFTVTSGTATADPWDLEGSDLFIGDDDGYGFLVSDSACSASAFLIGDGDSANNGDAFDGAGLVRVDGTALADDDGTVERTTSGGDTIVTMTPQAVSGLTAALELRSIGLDGTLRELLTLTNPGASPVTVTVTHESNWGSDLSTAIAGTSSGDSEATAADRWVVAVERLEDPGDTIPGIVVAGPGTLASPVTSLGTESPWDCSGTEGLTATYSVTVPAGAARSLMWFFQLTDTPQLEARFAALSAVPPLVTEALARMGRFDETPAAGAALVAGIDAAVLPTIVNWAYVPPTPTPTSSSTTSSSLPAAPVVAGAATARPAAPTFTG